MGSVARKPTYSTRHALALVATAFLTVLLLLGSAGPAAADGSGGGMMVVQPVRAPSGVFAGKRAVLTGHIDGHVGGVTITARRGSGDFLPVATAKADADGDFRFRWTPKKAGRWQLRLIPSGLTASSAAATEGLSGSVPVYRRQKTTWYGPGFYGKRTACGKKLTRRTLGVAHRTLPCGTRVEFFRKGRRIVVPVIDRGPFVRGVTWDLTLTAMKRLGSRSTEVLGVLPLGK